MEIFGKKVKYTQDGKPKECPVIEDSVQKFDAKTLASVATIKVSKSNKYSGCFMTVTLKDGGYVSWTMDNKCHLKDGDYVEPASFRVYKRRYMETGTEITRCCGKKKA